MTHRLAANLAALADFLADQNVTPPTVTAYPHSGVVTADWMLFGDSLALTLTQQRAQAAEIIRALDGRWDKVDKGYYHFTRTLAGGGVELAVVVNREAVCERVVTGTREVTRTLPAVEAQPERTVTETVEDVKWRCASVLADLPAEVTS